MSALGQVRAWMRAVLRRRTIEREVHEEMALHIEQAALRFEARGLSPRDALYAARQEFGHASVLQDEARDARGGRWVETLATDVRHAFRYFARTPLTTVTIVLVLVLGIGASAGVFAVADAALRRPPSGVQDTPSLVAIRGIAAFDGRRLNRSFSQEELSAYTGLPSTFESVAGWASSNVVLDLGDGRAGVSAVVADFVTANFFQVLGVRLAAGTGLAQGGAVAHGSPELRAVVSHAFATDHFGTAGNALRQHLRLNDVVVEIVGVAPPRFRGLPRHGPAPTFWLPMSARPVIGQLSGAFVPGVGSFSAIGRLQEGVALADATAAVTVAGARAGATVSGGAEITIAEANAAADARNDTRARATARALTDVVRLRGATGVEDHGFVVAQIAALSAVVVLILLVCITTAGSLLVGAGIGRRAEIGVRLALGASRARIVRQLLTESALLALVGGGLGLLILAAASRVLGSVIENDIVVHWPTVMFTTACALAVAVLCGLSPALHATRSGLQDVLKDASRGATSRSRLQRGFVVAQIALTQPLLVGLAMIIVALHSFGAKAGSTSADRLILADFDAWAGGRGAQHGAIETVVERLAAVPGVTSVLPLANEAMMLTLETPSVDGTAAAAGPQRRFQQWASIVPVGYFAALDIALVGGREFKADDELHRSSIPTIITAGYAKELFGAGNAVGRRLRINGKNEVGGVAAGALEIVGVVAGDSVVLGTGTSQRMFVAQGSGPRNANALLIRTSSGAAAFIPLLRKVARAAAPTIPLRSMQTLAEISDSQRSSLLRATSASAAGGLVVLWLAAIGLYAVVALSVGQRRREVGIRVAMGARPAQVVAMFFGRGVKLSVVGLAIGLPLSAAAARAASQRAGMPGTNIIIIAMAIAVCVVAVAALASWLPSRRAAHVDPVVALRAE